MGNIREDAINAGLDQPTYQVWSVGGVGENQQAAVMDLAHHGVTNVAAGEMDRTGLKAFGQLDGRVQPATLRENPQ